MWRRRNFLSLAVVFTIRYRIVYFCSLQPAARCSSLCYEEIRMIELVVYPHLQPKTLSQDLSSLLIYTSLSSKLQSSAKLALEALVKSLSISSSEVAPSKAIDRIS